jgi:hypothetical protein
MPSSVSSAAKTTTAGSQPEVESTGHGVSVDSWTAEIHNDGSSASLTGDTRRSSHMSPSEPACSSRRRASTTSPCSRSHSPTPPQPRTPRLVSRTAPPGVPKTGTPRESRLKPGTRAWPPAGTVTVELLFNVEGEHNTFPCSPGGLLRVRTRIPARARLSEKSCIAMVRLIHWHMHRMIKFSPVRGTRPRTDSGSSQRRKRESCERDRYTKTRRPPPGLPS